MEKSPDAVTVSQALQSSDIANTTAESRSGGQAAGELPTVAGYQIRRELGRGGMGVVYEAIHVKARRTVALKMIIAGTQAALEDISRFRVEAEALARLQHPGIVQVYDVG